MALFDGKLEKIALVYVLVQVIIWVKAALFFSWYGFGKVMWFNKHLMPEQSLFFDFVFHSAGHVAIGLIALYFGMNMKKIEWRKLVLIVGIAVALHNVGYWFTASHPSLEYVIFDFARDFLILLLFVLFGKFGLAMIVKKGRGVLGRG